MHIVRFKPDRCGGCLRNTISRPRVGSRFLSAMLWGVVVLVCSTASPASAQLCDGWTLETVGGPTARTGTAVAYDQSRGVTVLFGGYRAGRLGDTWEWDGQVWRLVATDGPARDRHAMVYDSVRNVIVLFGGFPDYNETWEWDGREWVRRSTTGPHGRIDHAMAFDEDRGVTVLFGGWDTRDEQFKDTWEWDGATWTLVSTTGPRERLLHKMVYDRSLRRVVMYGGNYGTSFGGRWADTWEWDGRSWSFHGIDGPGERSSHLLAYDVVRDRVVLFGGFDGNSRLHDTWERSDGVWSRVYVGGPSTDNSRGMVFDEAREIVVLIAVPERSGPLDQIWSFSCALLTLEAVVACPEGGPILIEWQGATPSGEVALVYSPNAGSMAIPRNHFCAGGSLGVSRNGVRIAWRGSSGPQGTGSVAGSAPPAACGGHLQMVDVNHCMVSNVVRIE